MGVSSRATRSGGQAESVEEREEIVVRTGRVRGVRDRGVLAACRIHGGSGRGCSRDRLRRMRARWLVEARGGVGAGRRRFGAVDEHAVVGEQLAQRLAH